MNELKEFIENYAQSKPAKIRKPPYRKPESVRELERLHFEHKRKKHPDMPFPVRTKFEDMTANGLTRCVIEYLQLHGHQAERINVIGRPIDNSRVVTDCLGRQRRIGSIKWIPSGSTPGSADVSATIRGRSVKIEIKTGRDRQSEHQKKYQKQIEQAGGTYLIVRNFDNFLEQIKNIL